MQWMKKGLEETNTHLRIGAEYECAIPSQIFVNNFPFGMMPRHSIILVLFMRTFVKEGKVAAQRFGDKRHAFYNDDH